MKSNYHNLFEQSLNNHGKLTEKEFIQMVLELLNIVNDPDFYQYAIEKLKRMILITEHYDTIETDLKKNGLWR